MVVKDQLQRMARILEISHELTATVSLKRLLERILQAAVELTGSESAGILLLDDCGKVLRFVAASRFSDQLVGLPVPIDGSIAGAAFSSGQPVVVADAHDDPRYYREVEEAIGLRAHSLLAVPLQFKERRIGVLEVENKKDAEFGPSDVEVLVALAAQATVAVENARLVADLETEIGERRRVEALLRQQSDQLRALAARLAEVEEAERRRLAAELHDQAGENLTAMGLNLSILRQQCRSVIGDPQARQALDLRLDDMRELLKEITRRIRRVMEDLRPPALDEYGLVAALRWYGNTLASRADLAVSVQGPETTVRLSPQREMALFRIAQEALTNVLRHARASEVVVVVEDDPALLRMTVADDGDGFESPAQRSDGGRPTWGLQIMQERAEAIGGTLHLASSPGKGTRVIVEVSR